MARNPHDSSLGFLGNLSRDQEARLLQLWSLVLHLENPTQLAAFEQLSQVNSIDRDGSPISPSFPRRNSLLMRTDSILARRTSTASFSTSTTPLARSLRNIGLAPSEIRSITKCLTYLTPDDVRWGLLTAAKHESPDQWLLRFLRFRKWNVGKAFVQVLEALRWRMREMHVDDQLLPGGELFALEQSLEESSRGADVELQQEFLDQLRKGKCFVHGVDRWNQPVCVLRVRLHRPDQETEESLHRLITHLIESARLLISPPVESATVIFDMTDITRANMEFGSVKFIIRCFESYYPQTLGTLLIHNAPRMFTGIWKVIKNWIDADVVTKIHFTKSVEDLAQFIPPNQIISELGGEEDWEYEYIEPDPDENSFMNDYDTRDSLLLERQEISEALFSLTSQWMEATALHDLEQINKIQSYRSQVVQQLRTNYWRLDPYVRARNWLDRTGVIQEEGCIEHYPTPKNHAQIETAKILEVAHIDRARVKLINV